MVTGTNGTLTALDPIIGDLRDTTVSDESAPVSQLTDVSLDGDLLLSSLVRVRTGWNAAGSLRWSRHI